jgi:hypothetical protein
MISHNETDDTNEKIFTLVNYIVGSISIVGGIFSIFLFWFFKEIRLFIYELIMYISASRVILDIAGFLPVKDVINGDHQDEKNQIYCSIQGILNITCQKFSWIVCTYVIYFSYYQEVKGEKLQTQSKILRLKLLLPAFLFSLAFALIAFFTNYIQKEDAGFFCTLMKPDQNSSHRLVVISYLIDIFFIVLNAYLIIRVTILIRKMRNKGHELRKMFFVVMFFPVLNFMCWLPSFFHSVQSLKELEHSHSLVLSLLISICSGIFTFLCGVLYSLLPHMKISLKAFLRSLFGCVHEFDLLEQNDFEDAADLANR